MSIHFLLVLNKQGKTRLAKWFDNSYSNQQKIIQEAHRLVCTRDLRHQSNFVEFHQAKLVYRRYAGLYFVMLIDLIDNELSYLESLHLLVEILDAYFDNVCELDLVFNFHKVYLIVDEMFMGGELQEILKVKVMRSLAVYEGH